MAPRKKNNLLSFTTKVAATSTIAEISALLVAKKATSITTDYNPDGRAVAIVFSMVIANNPITFRLTPNIPGCARKLPRMDLAQGERVAWRILLRWCEAQIAMVEMNQADIAQLFLPYAELTPSRTVYSAFLEGQQQKMLGAGE